MADEKRFERIYHNGGGLSGPSTTILVDKQTGVNYLYVASGYSGGLTVLVDAMGNPIVTPVTEEE